ncbi:MAG: FtsX-like permease family protein [Acidimicrobiales bacterium]
MAISPIYALRETGQNLIRNFMLSFATVITIGVSLWLFGGFFLFNYAVDNATERWEGGIEVRRVDAARRHRRAEQQHRGQPLELRGDQGVQVHRSERHLRGVQAALRRHTRDGRCGHRRGASPSYRVVPTDPDADVVQELVKQFEGRPGVRDVISADKTIRSIQHQADEISRVFLIGSVILLIAATLLILTNVVSAIRSRGAEIEIMKVVGATTWFIRIPFMLEGLAQAVLGALGAWVGLYFLRTNVINGLGDGDALQLMQGFRVMNDEYLSTSLLVLGIAVVVSGIGSMVAVTRYLDA